MLNVFQVFEKRQSFVSNHSCMRPIYDKPRGSPIAARPGIATLTKRPWNRHFSRDQSSHRYHMIQPLEYHSVWKPFGLWNAIAAIAARVPRVFSSCRARNLNNNLNNFSCRSKILLLCEDMVDSVVHVVDEFGRLVQIWFVSEVLVTVVDAILRCLLLFLVIVDTSSD